MYIKMPKMALYTPSKQQILMKKTCQFATYYKDADSKVAKLKQ